MKTTIVKIMMALLVCAPVVAAHKQTPAQQDFALRQWGGSLQTVNNAFAQEHAREMARQEKQAAIVHAVNRHKNEQAIAAARFAPFEQQAKADVAATKAQWAHEDAWQALQEDNQAMMDHNAAHVAMVEKARSQAAANKVKNSFVNRTSARVNSLWVSATSRLGLNADARDVRGLKKMIEVGIDVDPSSLTAAQRVALAREIGPVSRWQATKVYAGAAASAIKHNIARLAVYVRTNPGQALKKTVAAAGIAAAAGLTAYAVYKGVKAAYAWATAKPEAKKAAVSRTRNSGNKLVVPGKRPMITAQKAAPKKVAQGAKKPSLKKA